MFTRKKKKKKDSPAQIEKKRYKKKRNNFFDSFLNPLFKLDKETAQKRSLLLLVFIPSIFILWGLLEFSTLLNGIDASNITGRDVLFVFFRFALVFIPPYFIAIRLASRYLSDIFELKDYSIARKFIYQAAFASKYEKITIKDGCVADKDKNSPIIKIGGPGKVNVDLHSAVLFEKIDGRPHIIGPTNDVKDDTNVLNAFERYREAIDLRDINVGPKDFFARTQDGIKIEAKDVRISLSVNRGSSKDKKKLTSYKSYPFLEEAISGLIYDHTCDVSRNTESRSVCPLWSNSMGGKFMGRLKKFVGKHQLSQFISTEGEPEKKNFQDREENYQKMKDELLSEVKEEDSMKEEDDNGVDFQTRDKISALFLEFVQNFHEEYPKDNVVLNWIGIGTWNTPTGSIHKEHLESLSLNKENAKKGSEKSLKKIEDEEKYTEFLRLIQKVPLASANKEERSSPKKEIDILGILIPQPIKPSPLKISNDNYDKVVREILENYLALIKTARAYIPKYVVEDESRQVNRCFLNAIHVINESLTKPKERKAHHPEGSFPAYQRVSIKDELYNAIEIEKSEETKGLFQNLLAKVLRDTNTAINLIEYEREQSPNVSINGLLKNAIARWIRDNR